MMTDERLEEIRAKAADKSLPPFWMEKGVEDLLAEVDRLRARCAGLEARDDRRQVIIDRQCALLGSLVDQGLVALAAKNGSAAPAPAERLLPMLPLPLLEQVMQDHKDNPRRTVPWSERHPNYHVNHALEHIYAYMRIQARLHTPNPDEDEHLDHAACRLWLALAVRESTAGTTSNEGSTSCES